MLGSLLILIAAGVAPDLAQALRQAGPDEVFEVFVLMDPQPDWAYVRTLPTYKERVDYLRDLARVSQAALRRDLASGKIQAEAFRAYWSFNGFRMKVTRAELEKILARNDVYWVERVPQYVLFRGTPSKTPPPTVDKIAPWNIRRINADDLWNMGITGQGVILGILDSGFDTTHPALSGKFIRLQDFTPDGNPASDGIGHGTHTSGTIAGGDGPANGLTSTDIGVAPGANLVGAKVFDNTGAGSGDFSGAFQWIASLKADSGLDIRAVNNSWGICGGGNLVHWNDVLLWWNLDILPVFANGNADYTCSGPYYGSVSSPADYPTAVGVGATASNDYLADFSQWGPAPDQSPWNNPAYWYTPDWNLLKPDVSAPGVGVNSSVPGGSYQAWDGTSMASPHVTGAVALLIQANPFLTKYDLYQLLTQSASQTVTCGDCSSYPNNQAGWGRLDVLAAYNMLSQPFLGIDSVTTTFNGPTWDPGESMTIDIRIVNTGGDTAVNLSGTLSVAYSGISVTDNSDSWPNLAPSASAFTSGNGFTVQASSSATPGDVPFTLILTYNNPAGSSFVDTLTFTLPLGKPRYDVYDVNAGQLVVNFTSVGAFPSPSELGSAPASGSGYAFQGTNALYYGSFAAGTGFLYVVDRWYSATAGGTPNTDWVEQFQGRLVEITPPVLGDFMVASQMTDSGHASPKGLEVIQSAYTFSGANYGNIIMTQYAFFDRGAADINGLYAGFFMDFDIDDYSLNSGGVDASRDLVYMYNPVLVNLTDTLYVGIKFLGATGGTGVANLSLLHNPTDVYNGTSEQTKAEFLSGTRQMPTPDSGNADYSAVLSVGPFSLTGGAADTVYVAVAFLAANSLASLQAAADTAQALFPGFGPVVNVKELPVQPGWALAPKMRKGGVLFEVSVPRTSSVRMTILDPTGRRVREVFSGRLQKGNHRFTVQGLAQGVYFLRVDGDLQAVRRFVVLR